ncbi:hypothetical protein J6590_000195 [Homalodisca vitripennis]|nr:hypothetical protein J6590_000195 [Homalodisca vitripennis]
MRRINEAKLKFEILPAQDIQQLRTPCTPQCSAVTDVDFINDQRDFRSTSGTAETSNDS